MIQKKTILQSGDNTGAKALMCIGLLGCSNLNVPASSGAHIVVSVKRFIPHKKVKKGLVSHAVIIQTKIQTQKRIFGHLVRWSTNRTILLKKGDSTPLGSRISFFIDFGVRKKNFIRVCSLAIGIL